MFGKNKEKVNGVEQKDFDVWLVDWEKRFSMYASVNDVASSSSALLKTEELTFLIGLCKNSDLVLDELRSVNRKLATLIEVVQQD